jgi:phosphoribosylanthranilate isomerase
MVRIKICGITNAADALAAADAGANLLGFNFYEKSPRFITEEEARKIRMQLPRKVKAVGIFVNASPAEVTALCKFVKLDVAQLHGDETPEAVAEIARVLHVFKAFRVGPEFRLGTLDAYPGAFAFLFDAEDTGQYGGTGHSTDWDVAQQAVEGRRIILAGGLKVENVAAAVRIVRPYAVDVASGIESKPGIKDHGRLREFVQEVRRAERN